MKDREPPSGKPGIGKTRSEVCFGVDLVDVLIWICRDETTISLLSVDILGQILGDLADGHCQVLLIVDLFLQLGQPPGICFFCYPNQNASS